MLAQNINLNGHLYALTGADLTKSVRSAPVASGIHRTLTISKSAAKIEGIQNDRFLVRFDLTKPDPLGKAVRGTAYAVLNLPRDSATITPSDLADLMASLGTLLQRDSSVECLQVLNGEL
jgi:hypothetical protein